MAFRALKLKYLRRLLDLRALPVMVQHHPVIERRVPIVRPGQGPPAEVVIELLDSGSARYDTPVDEPALDPLVLALPRANVLPVGEVKLAPVEVARPTLEDIPHALPITPEDRVEDAAIVPLVGRKQLEPKPPMTKRLSPSQLGPCDSIRTSLANTASKLLSTE